MARSFGYSEIFIWLFRFALVAWALLVVVAPYAIPTGCTGDTSGSTVIIDNERLIDDLSWPWSFVYLSGDFMCHQMVERSFVGNENIFPFCVRCTAIWVGIAMGSCIPLVVRWPLDLRFFFVLCASIGPLAVDGVGQAIGLWASSSGMRLATGVLMGLGMGWALVMIFLEVLIVGRNTVVQKD